METQDSRQQFTREQRTGHIWGGALLLLVGIVILAKQMAFPFLPDWVFSWPMILIVIGTLAGIRHKFRGPFWLIMLVLGGIFMVDYVSPEMRFHRYIAPAVIISIGLAIIFRPRRPIPYGDTLHRRRWRRHFDPNVDQPIETPVSPVPGSPEDFVDSVSFFGGVHKVIVSKNFRGGEATSVLGGTELDLRQADIQGTVVLELTQVMGGAKIFVPGNWYIKNEINAVFGGVDDKRQVQATYDPNKVLILRGTSFFGGLEISNF